jgi:hypothetical protein
MTEATKALNSDKFSKSDILFADRIEDGDASAKDRSIFDRINVLGNTNNCFGTKKHIFGITSIPRNTIYRFIVTHLELPALA